MKTATRSLFLSFLGLVLTLGLLPKQLLGESLEEGYQAYIKTNFTGAKEALTAALNNETNPNALTKIHKLLGIVHYMLSDLNEAARSFKLALSYNPNISILQSEVLDETIITFFNRIKTLESTKITENPPAKKIRKRRFRYVKRRRPLTSMEKIYAALPFGVGQFMHEQYFFGALSGALQISALSYFAILSGDINQIDSDIDTIRTTDNLDEDVKVLAVADFENTRKEKQTLQTYALAGFVGLWAVSAIDAYLTPKYRRIKRRVYEGETRLLPEGYDLKFGIGPNPYEIDRPSLTLNLEHRF